MQAQTAATGIGASVDLPEDPLLLLAVASDYNAPFPGKWLDFQFVQMSQG